MGGPDFPDELDFWESILDRRPSTLFDPELRKLAFPEELRSCIASLSLGVSRMPCLLEVGSGPVSVLSYGVDHGLITVVAVDPLARAYRLLLKLNDLDYPIRPITGHAELLSDRFGLGSFDLVYSSNALDHCISPREAVRQMVRVLRPGGFLMLEGFERESSQANWVGLHQHDLFLENGCLMHVDRSGRLTNLTSEEPLVCVCQRVRKFRDRGIFAFGYEIPPGFRSGGPRDWRGWDWYTLVLRRE